MDATVAAAASDEARWTAVANALTQLIEATHRLQVQNETFAAKYDAEHEETRRRLDALERRDDQQVDRALDIAAAAAAQSNSQNSQHELAVAQNLRTSLSAQLALLIQNWRTAALVASLVVNAALAIAPHISLH